MDNRKLIFCSFSSGSSGNCYLVKTEETALIVDAGITGKAFMEGLSLTDTSQDEVSAILITHEHYDHIRGLSVIHNKIKQAPIYASQGTIGALAEKLGEKIYDMDFVPVEANSADSAGRSKPASREFAIGDITVSAFKLSHDAAEPLSYSFRTGGKSSGSGSSKIAIITDTGLVRDDIIQSAYDADVIIIEANYEKNMLLFNSKYPYELKLRIDGEYGHLSNQASADAISRCLKSRPGHLPPPRIFLAHLSKENNTPDNARVTVKSFIDDNGFMCDRDYYLDVLPRTEVGTIITI